MSSPSDRLSVLRDASSELDHLGLIGVTGADAAAFLHAQLTNGMLDLESGEVRLSGYCSAKGRLLAIALVWRRADDFWLLVPRELAAPLAKRLSMFVLRSKVKVNDVSAQYSLIGHVDAGNGAIERAADWLAGAAPAPSQTPARLEAVDGADQMLVHMPASLGLTRRISIRRTSDVRDEREGATQGDALWRWLDVRAGLPIVVAATQDRFVPQMVNLEALGGVDFKKGCYPGQEVVARSQYLGKLKRRTAGAHLASDAARPLPGDDILHTVAGQPQAIGTVVSAEASPLGGVDLLVEVPLASSGEVLTVAGHEQGLEIWPLPYVLPDNEVFVRPKL
jgi:folate-binding protein YgfZ